MSGHTYLIDASIYIFQAYFSPYSTAVSEEDEDVSAFVGFLQFLLSLQRREQPARGAVAMDNALFPGLGINLVLNINPIASFQMTI